jgi:catechol 2,3-dioxygenase-like lactoylglutathione lyase family enzyme
MHRPRHAFDARRCKTGGSAMIKGLHHNAYRCRDSEETRRFYEDFLGLPLAGTLAITETKTGRKTAVLHTFYRMDDGSFLAFFEAPDAPFEFKAQHDFDLHIALEVDESALSAMRAKGRACGIETRGVIDHGFIHSIYFRDPNGYVVELTAKTGRHAQEMDPATNGARAKLDAWQAEKAR